MKMEAVSSSIMLATACYTTIFTAVQTTYFIESHPVYVLTTNFPLFHLRSLLFPRDFPTFSNFCPYIYLA
jgi:hypothetical protein